MSGKSKKARGPAFLQVELLQNGIPIARTEKKIGGNFSVVVGSTKNCDLYVPYGPFSVPLALFQCEGGKLQALYGKKMRGFLKKKDCNAQVIHQKIEPTLVTGDYGWICFGEFRLIFKVTSSLEKRTSVKSLPRTKTLESPFDFVFASGIEAKAFVASCFAATLLCTGAFLTLKSPAVSKRETLASSFRLTWVSYEHFPTLPEILQKNYDRSDLVKTATDFVEQATRLISFGEETESSSLLSSTKEIWEKSFADQTEELARIQELQTHNAKLISTKPHSAVLVIPAALGETIEAKALRTLDKLKLLRTAAEKNLEMRRAFTPDFEAESTYDFTSTSSPAKPVDREASGALSKVHVFKPTSDEERMYLDVKNIGDEAKFLQARNLRNLALTNISTTAPIALAKDLEGLRLALPGDERLSERSAKIDRIPATEVGAKKIVVAIQDGGPLITEPAQGILEPKIVERTVAENRYQLQACYEMALRRNLNTKGLMEWEWQVDQRGRVISIALISSTIQDKQMVDCVRSRLASWQFPRPRRGNVAIKYPFEFKASERNKGG